jgi:hypothetical protein
MPGACTIWHTDRIPGGQIPTNLIPSRGHFLIGMDHRDKAKLQTPTKMFPYLKLLCWLFMSPTLGFATLQRNSFLILFFLKDSDNIIHS